MPIGSLILFLKQQFYDNYIFKKDKRKIKNIKDSIGKN